MRKYQFGDLFQLIAIVKVEDANIRGIEVHYLATLVNEFLENE